MSNPEEFQPAGFGAMPLSGYNFTKNIVRGSIASLLWLKSSQRRRNQKRKIVFTTLVQINAVLFRNRKEGNVFV